MITVTYISKDRPIHLNNSLLSLINQTVLPSKIVVTDCSELEQNAIKKVIEDIKSKTSVPIEYVWRSKENLTRSQGRSLGRKLSSTPIIASTESDILFPNNLIETCLKEFGNPPKKVYAQPYWMYQREDGSYPDIPTHYKGGFFQAYRSEDFDAIGGYNPFLIGWGWEDNDFDERILKYGCRHVVLPLVVRHMWHKQTANSQTHDNNRDVAGKSFWDVKTNEWKMK